MMRHSCVFIAFAVSTAMAQAPAAPIPPTAEERREIDARVAELSSRVKTLADRGVDRALLADIDVYRRAAEYILKFPEEFATKAFVPNTIAVLDTGLARAKELKEGAPSWPKRKGHVVRG